MLIIDSSAPVKSESEIVDVVVDETFALQIAKVVGLHATFSERFSAISVGRHREPILWAVEHQTGYFLY